MSGGSGFFVGFGRRRSGGHTAILGSNLVVSNSMNDHGCKLRKCLPLLPISVRSCCTDRDYHLVLVSIQG